MPLSALSLLGLRLIAFERAKLQDIVQEWAPVRVLLIVAALGLSTSCGDEREPASASSTSTSSSSTPSSSFAESEMELARLMGALSKAAAGTTPESRARFDSLVSSLELPNAAAFFRDVFRDELGKRLAADYDVVAGQFTQLRPLFINLANDGNVAISVERFDSPGSPGATGYQNLALSAMKNRTPLYSVRFTRPPIPAVPGAAPVKNTSGTAPTRNRGFHLWSLIYLDGGFRWIGKNKAVYDAGSSRQAGPTDEVDLLELRARDAASVRAVTASPT